MRKEDELKVKGTLSRRDFLKASLAGVAAAAASGVLGACGPTSAETESNTPSTTVAETTTEAVAPIEPAVQRTWKDIPEPITEDLITATYEADVIVVGAGHAGTCAARAAAEAGASVLVLETQEEEAQYVNGNEIGAINSQFALGRGVPKYNTYDFVNECQLRSLNRGNPIIYKQFAEHSGATVDWFMEPLSQEFIDSVSIFMNPMPKYYPGSYHGMKTFTGTASFFGEGYTMTMAIRANQEIAKGKGAQFFFGVSGRQLLKKEDAVIGVIGQDLDGNYIKFTSRKGVILACGGFGNNSEMVQDLIGEMSELCATRGENIISMDRDGSGIQMGVWAGGHVESDPRAAIYANQSGLAGAMGATAFLRLNEAGERYMNEAMFGPWGQGARSTRQSGTRVCAVFDSNWREELEYQPPEHFGVDMGNPEMLTLLESEMNAIVPGPDGGQVHATTWTPVESFYTFYAANTIEELAGYLGYEGDAAKKFIDNVARYNTLCENGLDEDFGKEPMLMHPIKTAPFYGYVENITMGFMVVTLSGLFIDEQSRVLNDDFQPIPGLYAIGNNAGCRFAVQYMTPIPGFSVGIAQTFGRLVGTAVAKSTDIA